MMENKHKEMTEKKEYIPPTIEVTMVEMECGISSTSATLVPKETVKTDWEGDDNQDVTIPWK